MNDDAEVWRAVVGYEDLYEVSSEGRIKSLEREDSRGRRIRERILKQYVIGSGYCRVNLYDGKPRGHLAQHLVLEAFVSERPSGHECRHLNGDNTDNRLANLEWVPRSVNKARGLDHGNGTYTEAEVELIRKLRDSGMSRHAIARRIGCTESQVGHVIAGRTRVCN